MTRDTKKPRYVVTEVTATTFTLERIYEPIWKKNKKSRKQPLRTKVTKPPYL